MQTKVSFLIDTDVYDKLQIALQLTGADKDEMFQECMKSYISKTFESVSKEYGSDKPMKQSGDKKEYFGKAIQRIPTWSLKPNQYNHKIIRAFLEAERGIGAVKLETMEKLCSDKQRPELYVPTFRNNYAQMKIDGPKSHGKVFEDDGDTVWIWKEVEEVLRKYQGAFLV